jgi:AraC family cel operon transcriptional repressor
LLKTKPMTTKKFFLRDFIQDQEAFHLARVTIQSRQDLSMHQHDFAEIFWVESGTGTHLVNGRQLPLKPGHLVMMRPADAHTFTAPKAGITLMNPAFSTDTLRFLKDRYFADTVGYFWTSQELPFQTLLDLPVIQQISRWAEDTLKHRKSNFHLDRLLLFIFNALADRENPAENQPVPFWLGRALRDFHTPALFKKGPQGFADLCDKNIDHVNRTVRRCFGKSLSGLVTELRMGFAARQLVLTNASHQALPPSRPTGCLSSLRRPWEGSCSGTTRRLFPEPSAW